MNKVDFPLPVPIREANSACRATSAITCAGRGVEGRRSAPRASNLVLPVWGYQYVRQFLELGLPTLLSPGNVPAIAQRLPTEFILLTSIEDEPFIREHPTFKQLSAVCATQIRSIDHLITDGNHSTTITLAYTEAVRAVGDAMLDTCFFFLVSDYIMADGSLASAIARMELGASAVVVGNFQISSEEALPWFHDKLRLAKNGSLALPPRELMHWALNYLHPTTIANTVNVPFSHNSQTNRLFWRVDSNTVLGRFYLMHMLCVRPELTDFVIGSSCDYSFVPEMCPSGKIEAITDSDEYLVIEMQPRNHESGFLRPGPLKPRVLAKSLSQWATGVHRNNANYSLVFHAGPPPSQLALSIREADKFISKVAQHLSRRPVPYRGHPYWRGAVVAFQDATGHRIDKADWSYAFGMPASGDWFTRRLLWRAKKALMGQPPYVLPWHPSWPDFRNVLEELKAFFSDRSLKLLMLSNEPTAFSVALADSGDRVRRLRCMPFLQSFPERNERMRDTFGLCLLELSEGDMQYGGELIDRIAPLMKDGGSIIIFVTNRRPVDTAHEFGNGVTCHAPRFYRAGTLVTEVYFVPANRLRWFVHRSLINLGRFMSRSRWAMLPAAALGILLLSLSFVGSIDVLRRRREVGHRGIASSFIMRLSVDAAKVAHSYTYSRFDIARKKLAGHRLPRSSANLMPDFEGHTRESQYRRCLKIKETVGLTSLGLMTNQVWYDDPRHLTFLLVRYKFVSKMMSGRRNVGEVGCGDAFGTRVVLQEVPDVTVYDFDPGFIADVQDRRDERWPLKAEVHDIVEGPLPRRHEGLFSLDVIEHISTENEHAYLTNLRGSLQPDGVLIIGTPSVESQAYASPLSRQGHLNRKSGQELKVLLENYFTGVFLFSMNDEVVHTGFYPMADYLFAICTGPK